LKDAVRDGLRAVKNVIEDQALVPGAGAFELAAHVHLSKWKYSVKGRAKLGVQAYADAMLIIPKTLAQNSGLDAQETLITLLDQVNDEPDAKIGIDVDTGKGILPEKLGIWDSYRVKKQFLHLGSMVATKLMLVDEIIRAGRKMNGKEA
jgi:T-complex protein 1 subunit zeta